MRNIGFTVLSVLFVIVLGAGGYLAISSFRGPAEYLPTHSETVGDLHQVQTEPQTSIPEPTSTVPQPTQPTPAPSNSGSDLAKNLQGLIDSKTTVKVGSKGPAVGYIQQFLNLYFKKSLKVDNDYGKTAETNVKAFQKAVGVTQTGQIGPATLGKMIEWLSKNPQ